MTDTAPVQPGDRVRVAAGTVIYRSERHPISGLPTVRTEVAARSRVVTLTYAGLLTAEWGRRSPRWCDVFAVKAIR